MSNKTTIVVHTRSGGQQVHAAGDWRVQDDGSLSLLGDRERPVVATYAPGTWLSVSYEGSK